MSYSNISAVLLAADKATVQTSVQTIKTKLPFLVHLSNEEHKKLRKMKAVRVSYVQDVYTTTVNNPSAIPGGLSTAEYAKDLALLKDVEDLLSWITPMYESLSDTHMALGSELMTQTDECYGYLKLAAKKSTNQSLKMAVQNIANQLKHKPKTLPPANGNK